MMPEFIANRVLEARDKSIKEGKAKYKAYFVTLKIYARYQNAVDAILIAEGAEDCIVTD